MAINKVIYGSETLIDLSSDTVSAETLAEGETAHSASGEQIVGTMAVKNGTLTLNGTTYDGTTDVNVTTLPTYLSSTDTENLVNLRDLDSGTYILSGKFKPFSGSSSTLTFSSDLIVNVVKQTSSSSVQVLYPVNNAVQHLQITDTDYTRTNVYLNNLYNNAELTTNKVTTLSESSTDTQYPTAKCVYDFFNTQLGVIENGTY